MEIKSCMDNFTKYYNALPQNHHRELKWNFAMGTGQLMCKIPNIAKTYDLVVSTYQMCILCLFNYKSEYTLKEICESMGFDEDTSKKNLHSLTMK